MAGRRPLTEMAPMQVQRPPGHRRKVYGKKKTKAMDEIFRESPDPKAITTVGQENQDLTKELESLNIDDNNGDRGLPDRTDTHVEALQSKTSKSKGKGNATDRPDSPKSNSPIKASDRLHNVLIFGKKEDYESRLQKAQIVVEIGSRL